MDCHVKEAKPADAGNKKDDDKKEEKPKEADKKPDDKKSDAEATAL